MRAVAILGAGWSAEAERPLARRLFDDLPYAASAEAQRHQLRVREEWRQWRQQHEQGLAEEFIAAMAGTALWPRVVQYVAARLAEPDQVRTSNELRYGERVDKPSPARTHHQFMETMFRNYDVAGVVTTNYDLLVERTLLARAATSSFFYAGIVAPRLMGASTFSVRHKWVDAAGRVPLCKLHGSLNWYVSGSRIEAVADCRPAYRTRNVSYIVAPGPEKRIPPALSGVWDRARLLLAAAEEWVVVGYSAPAYDQAIAELLTTSASRALRQVRVIDPDQAASERYRALTDKAVRWDGSLESFCTS